MTKDMNYFSLMPNDTQLKNNIPDVLHNINANSSLGDVPRVNSFSIYEQFSVGSVRLLTRPNPVT
jgi:hypothetical protein